METVGVEVVHKTLSTQTCSNGLLKKCVLYTTSSTSLFSMVCKYNKYYLVGGCGNEFKYIFNIIGSSCGGWTGHPGDGEG